MSENLVSLRKNPLMNSLYFFYFLSLFLKGWKQGDKKGVTPPKSYAAFRNLFVMTDGRFNDIVSSLLSIRHPKYKNIEAKGALGDLTESEVKNIGDHLRKEGYYVSPRKLDAQVVDRLVDFARKTPILSSRLTTMDGQLPSTKEVMFDDKNPISPVYRIEMEHLFNNPDIQRIILDQSFFAVAQEYLNCSPVLDLVNMWWSVPFNNQKKTEAAQEYHFDMDKVKFLKIFIYLTDVDADAGPHCYVRGSHIRKPKALLLDDRKTDEEILAHYPASDLIEVCGKAGSIIFGDTRCWHKGKPVLKNSRLVLQLEFTNSDYGQNNLKVPFTKSFEETFNGYIQKYPRTYRQIFSQ